MVVAGLRCWRDLANTMRDMEKKNVAGVKMYKKKKRLGKNILRVRKKLKSS